MFNSGALIGFLSQCYPLLLIGRVTQATGCGAIPALSMIITTRYFPYEMKGRVLGLISSTVAFGLGIGPVVGGFITGTLHWRFLFIISMTTIITFPFAWRYLPDRKRGRARIDVTGAILMTCSISSFLAFITLGLWRILPFSIAIFIWFLVHIQKSDTPFLSPSMFKNRPYRNMNITVFIFSSLSYSVNFMIPLMLRAIYDFGAMNIGLVLFPGAIMGAIASVVGGRFIDRVGGIPILYTSMTLLLTGILFLSTFSGLNPWIIVLSLTVCYIDSSLFMASSSHSVSSTLSMEHQGIGMGIYNLFFFMSAAISAALTGKVLDLTRGHTPINIFNSSALAGPYSNLFLLMVIIGLCTIIMLYMSFRGKSTLRY